MRFVPLLAVVISSSCSMMQRSQTEQIVAATLVSDQQETELGFQVHEELKKENTKFLENPDVGFYVGGLVQKLTPFADKDRPGVKWQYFVIDDPKTVNAFVTPGGRIYLYTGLLLAADSEAEVVGVLGHELAHVVARHTARQLVAAKGLETVAAMALGKDPSDVAQLAAALVGKGSILAYGRDMELEADQYGARYANAAGFDPKALASFFEKLRAKGEVPELLTFLSTHPANTERIEKINAAIAANGWSSTEQGVAALKAIQAKLAR
ncbi:MAG: M48 family metalloprotease [Myxococcaceae bacterium]|jgi:predicted Zn-dependent protease|nr:M48 family metalloprotease [Myxococcaceae bacterium]